MEDKEILYWIAEHLTHLRIAPTDDRIDIEFIDDKGCPQTSTYTTLSDESYSDMIRSAITGLSRGSK